MGAGGIHTGFTRLTYKPSAMDPDRYKGPIWSPDGLSIALVSRQTGTARIRVIAVLANESDDASS